MTEISRVAKNRLPGPNSPTTKTEKSHVDSAARSKECYDRDPESGKKLATKSKVSYHEDIEKSRVDTATRSKAYYHKDTEKSRAESATNSKAGQRY